MLALRFETFPVHFDLLPPLLSCTLLYTTDLRGMASANYISKISIKLVLWGPCKQEALETGSENPRLVFLSQFLEESRPVSSVTLVAAATQ